MREHHQGVLLHHQFGIRQSPVQLLAVLVDDRAERDRDVAERDGDVATDVRVSRGLQDAEEQVVVRVAELRAYAEEFAKGERRHRPQRRILKTQKGVSIRLWRVEIFTKYEP